VDEAISEPSGWNKTRLEALSDGVFAIAMTLLVLEIKVPELDRHVDAATLWRAVRGLWPLFFSFLVTFMLTSLFWFWHHVSLHCIRRVDGVIVWINLVFLMFVSLAPFSTAMLGSFTLRQPVSLAFYFGNQLALGLALNAYWIYAKRQGLLVNPGIPIVRRFSMAIRVQPIACLVTLAMIAVNPQWCFNTFAIVQIPTAVYMRRQLRAERRR
jgi:uncharacterized membrane protein